MTTKVQGKLPSIIEEMDPSSSELNSTEQKTEQVLQRTLSQAQNAPAQDDSSHEAILYPAETAMQTAYGFIARALEEAGLHGASHAVHGVAGAMIGTLETIQQLRHGKPVEEAVKKGAAKAATDVIVSLGLGPQYLIISEGLRVLSHQIPDFDLPAHVIFEDINCDVPIPMGQMIRGWLSLPARVQDIVQEKIEGIGKSVLVQKHIPSLIFNPLGMSYIHQNTAAAPSSPPLPDRTIPIYSLKFPYAGCSWLAISQNLPSSLQTSLPVDPSLSIEPDQRSQFNLSENSSVPKTIYNPNAFFYDPNPFFEHVSLGVLSDPRGVFRIDFNLPFPIFLPSLQPWTVVVNVGVGIYYLFKTLREKRTVEKAEIFISSLSPKIVAYNQAQGAVQQAYENLNNQLKKAPRSPNPQSPEDVCRYYHLRIFHLEGLEGLIQATVEKEKAAVTTGKAVHDLTGHSQRQENKKEGISDKITSDDMKTISKPVKKAYLDKEKFYIPELEKMLRIVQGEKAALQNGLPAARLRVDYEGVSAMMANFLNLEKRVYQIVEQQGFGFPTGLDLLQLNQSSQEWVTAYQNASSLARAWFEYTAVSNEFKSFISAYKKLPSDQHFLEGGEAGIEALEKKVDLLDRQIEQTRFYVGSLEENRAGIEQMKASQSPDLPSRTIVFAKKLVKTGQFQEAANLMKECILQSDLAELASEAAAVYGIASYFYARSLLETEDPKACVKFIQTWFARLPEAILASDLLNMASLHIQASIENMEVDPRPMIQAIDQWLSTHEASEEARQNLSKSRKDLHSLLQRNVNHVYDRYREWNLLGEVIELALSRSDHPHLKHMVNILHQPRVLRSLVPYLISTPYQEELLQRLKQADNWMSDMALGMKILAYPAMWAHALFQSKVSRKNHPALRWVGHKATLLPSALLTGANLLTYGKQIHNSQADGKGVALSAVSSLSAAAGFLDQALITTGVDPQGVEGLFTNACTAFKANKLCQRLSHSLSPYFSVDQTLDSAQLHIRAGYRAFQSRDVSTGLTLANIVYNYGDLGVKRLSVSEESASKMTQYTTWALLGLLAWLGYKSYQSSLKEMHLEEMENHLDQGHYDRAWAALHKSKEKNHWSKMISPYETYLLLMQQIASSPVASNSDRTLTALDLASYPPSQTALYQKAKTAVDHLEKRQLAQQANRLNLELIEVYIQKGNYQAAEAQIAHVHSPHAHQIRAKIAQKKAMENPAHAIHHLTKAIDHLSQAHTDLNKLYEKDLPQAQIQYILSQLKKVEKEIEHLRCKKIHQHVLKKQYSEAEALFPLVNHPEIFIYRGKIALERDNLQQALTNFEQARQAYISFQQQHPLDRSAAKRVQDLEHDIQKLRQFNP